MCIRDSNYSYEYHTVLLNEDNDTDDIDINIDKLNEFNKYKKPWYELTQYNFSYFRNAIKEHPNTVSDKLRRVYGNYFVVRFIFNNSDNKRIEFESLEMCIRDSIKPDDARYLGGNKNSSVDAMELQGDRKSTRLNSSHVKRSRMPSSA